MRCNCKYWLLIWRSVVRIYLTWIIICCSPYSSQHTDYYKGWTKERYILQQVHTYSKDKPVFSSVGTAVFFQGFQQLVPEVFRLLLAWAGVRMPRATHLVPLSYHGVQREQFSLFFPLIFQLSVFVTSYETIHNLCIRMCSLWGRSVYKHVCCYCQIFYLNIYNVYRKRSGKFNWLLFFMFNVPWRRVAKHVQTLQFTLTGRLSYSFPVAVFPWIYIFHWLFFLIVILIWQDHLSRTDGTCFSYSCYHL